jgi:hypothetical protein
MCEELQLLKVSVFWRILHGPSFCPYHMQQVEALTPDHHARVVFCKWLLAKCIVSTQFVANILFIDEEGFTRDGIMNWHDTHLRMDENPHITMASRLQHQFCINVWVDILGDQVLGPVVLTNRCRVPSFFGKLFTSTLGICASSSTTHVIHACWGTILSDST